MKMIGKFIHSANIYERPLVPGSVEGGHSYSSRTYRGRRGRGEQTLKSTLCGLGGLHRGAQLSVGGYRQDDLGKGGCSPSLLLLPTRDPHFPQRCPQFLFLALGRLGIETAFGSYILPHPALGSVYPSVYLPLLSMYLTGP